MYSAWCDVGGMRDVPVLNNTPIITVRSGSAPFARQTHDAGGRLRSVVSAARRRFDDGAAARFVGFHYAHGES
jgi:hypothetical protein